MLENTFLQIFLLVNVFIMGVLATIALRHAYAHFRPHPLDYEKPHPQDPAVHLSQVMREKLIEASQAHFQTVLSHSATELQHDLKITAAKLNKQLDKLGGEIIASEMKRYHSDLENLRKQAETVIHSAQTDIAEHQTDLKNQLNKHQDELKTQLDEKMKAEQQRLIQDMDSKLSDAVASFLVETMQHNIDLGSQSPYLISMLEEHKAELIKEIANEN